MGRKFLMVAAALGVAALLSAAVGAGAAQDAGRGGGDEAQLTSELRVTKPLAAGGRVSLKNINGSVRVAVWDRPEVRVDAVKKARTQKRLDEADIQVTAADNAVSIRTVYPDAELRFERGGRDNPASVEYSLTVPRDARVDSIELINGSLEVEGPAGEIKASSVNGRLVARGLSGPARLSTINGPLEVSFDRLASGTVSLGSVNGPLTVTLPPDADATLRATTIHGTITNDLGLTAAHSPHTGSSLGGVLGGGAARLRLDNVNGSIHVRRAAGGGAR
jgi:DUF4097 and DUF4098 domain-containing protein YvlB